MAEILTVKELNKLSQEIDEISHGVDSPFTSYENLDKDEIRLNEIIELLDISYKARKLKNRAYLALVPEIYF